MCVPSTDLQINYVNALRHQIEQFIEANPEIKIYGFDIGGGTPTSLDSKVFADFMIWIGELLERQTTTSDFEPSIEGSFETLIENGRASNKSYQIAKAGFKRLSVGVQSTSDNVLNPLHRNNISVPQMGKAIEEWHRHGISKINLDLMYGLPGQTIETIKKDIEVIRELAPEQVTVYEFRINQLKTNYKPDTDKCYNQYCELYNGLSRLGYYGDFGRNTFSRDLTHYGISSYLRHRMFDGWQYKGFGISAQSMSRYGVSYNVGKNVAIGKIIGQKWLINHGSTYESPTYYRLPPQELLNKFIAISGYSGGISLAAARSILGEDFESRYSNQISFLLQQNLATLKSDRIQLTPTGFRHYGPLLSLFYKR